MGQGMGQAQLHPSPACPAQGWVKTVLPQEEGLAVVPGGFPTNGIYGYHFCHLRSTVAHHHFGARHLRVIHTQLRCSPPRGDF